MTRTAQGSSAGRPAFTLLELLVVIVIIATLVAILLPAIGAAYQFALNVNCQSNLKQIATAALSYASDYYGAIPPTCYHRKDADGFHDWYWCNLLAQRGLTDLNTAPLAAGAKITQNSVFLCPSSTDQYVQESDAADSSGGFLYPDHSLAQGWYRLGNASYKTDCSYYWNGYSTSSSQATTRRYPSQYADDGETDSKKRIDQFHYLSQMKQRASTVMVADGTFFDGTEKPQRIAARHAGDQGDRRLTNLAFYDAHVESLQRICNTRPLSWASDPIMSRSPALEGGPPYFLLPPGN